MKIILESEKDLNKFVATRQLGNTEVIIDGKLLVKVISGYNKEIGKLETEKYVQSNNLVENHIQEAIEIRIEYGKEDITEAEIKEEVIEDVKEELAKLKAEEDLTSVDLIPYNFVYMLYDAFDLEPEAIIRKIEKDLSEIEVPVNAVEESVEMEAN